MHGADTLDSHRASSLDHVHPCAPMCAYLLARFGDVAVLLRSSKDQKVRKHESERRWEKLDWGPPIQEGPHIRSPGSEVVDIDCWPLNVCCRRCGFGSMHCFTRVRGAGTSAEQGAVAGSAVAGGVVALQLSLSRNHPRPPLSVRHLEGWNWGIRICNSSMRWSRPFKVASEQQTDIEQQRILKNVNAASDCGE
jgi:hypothetical protein